MRVVPKYPGGVVPEPLRGGLRQQRGHRFRRGVLRAHGQLAAARLA